MNTLANSIADNARSAPSRVLLDGLLIEVTSRQEFVETINSSLRVNQGGWVCTVNLDILRQHHYSEAVRELLKPVSHHVADGRPLLWAARLQRVRLPERVCGSDLIYDLTEAAAQSGKSIFLLGGNSGTADRAGEILKRRYPGLQVAGTACPEFGFEKNPATMQRLIDDVVNSKADIVYVGLGFPKQEKLISLLRQYHPNAWYLGVGISFSFVAGEVNRAPKIMQAGGLEWLHRLYQEPGRLWKRYILYDIPFLLILAGSAIRARGAADLSKKMKTKD